MNADVAKAPWNSAVLDQLQALSDLLRTGTSGTEIASLTGEVRSLLSSLEEEEREVRRQRAALDEAVQEVHADRLRYLAVFDAAPDACLLTDKRGIIVQANRAAALLFDCRKDPLVDKPFGLFLDEASRRTFYARLASFNRGETRALHGWELNLVHGRRRLPVAASMVPLHDDAGHSLGFRWLLRDISERLQTESALRAEKLLSDSLLDTAQAIVLILDQRGVILRTNRYLRIVSGYEEQELVGSLWDRLVPESERSMARRLLMDTLTFGVGRSGVGRLLARDGRERRIAWSAKSLVTEDSEHAFALVLGHDITQLHEVQQQALQKERLAAIGQVLATLAHESRNALQRCAASLERLGWRVEGQPELLDLVRRAQSAQADLTRLFEDLRGYVRPLNLEPRRCDVGDVWRTAWEQVTSVHAGRAVGLRESGAEVSLGCHADPFQLAQVFRNLFENAMAACPGPVQVEILCREVSLEAGPGLWVAVRDNGPGIPPEQHEKIFEPFFTTKLGGTGLGLAISKRIVEAHGGHMAAGAVASGGAEIAFTLPRSIS